MQYKTEYQTINGKTKKVPEKKEQDKKQKTSTPTSGYDESSKTSYKGE